jgi:predicted ATPase/DNA-binding XRE family transcriptional regulator
VSGSACAFGDLLREFRLRAGLSQSELAERANISEAAIGSLERGVRKVPYRSTVALLARALDLSEQDSAALEVARAAARTKVARRGFAHNIAAERTSFIGREADVRHILRLLLRSRLVSVTGSGGVGKTRVVLETARRLIEGSFPEVWFIDLGPLADGDFLAAKIAHTVQPSLGGLADTLPKLASALAERHMLLILDNCEHIVEQAARAADTILEGCPRISILTTTRERLNVAGEFVYRLPSLTLPPTLPDRIEEAQKYSAIDLFVKRAEAADPRVDFNSTNLPLVVDVARRLNGIPLAIELTAAQLPVLGLEALQARLHEYADLSSGRRDLPARQQTVVATIQWSYDLLTPQERALLCDVAIFAGGFTLSAAEAVCARSGLARSLVLSILSSLVNKSLIDVQTLEDNVRYLLLESVRAFGLARLQESGRHTSVARDHAQWLAALAEEIESNYAYVSTEGAAALLPDLDNIRAALAWSLGATDMEDRAFAGVIVSGFFGLWECIGRGQEHRQWIESALARIDHEHQPLVASYLLRGFILRALYEPNTLDAIAKAVRLCEQSGNRLALAKLHIVVAQARAVHGMLAEAERSAELAARLLAAEQKQDSIFGVALLFSRSYIRMRQGRFDDARADLTHAQGLARSIGDRSYLVCMSYLRRSEVEYGAGDRVLALEYLQRMLDSEFGSDERVGTQALLGIVNLRLQLGDVEGAAEPLRELLLQVRRRQSETHAELEYAALALVLRQRSVAAARLLGCVGVLTGGPGFGRSPVRQDAYDLLCARLKELLDDDAIAAAAADGARLTADEAAAFALAALARDRISTH